MESVKRAVLLLWITLGISAVGALINRWIGATEVSEFGGTLLIYALCAIFPYKISRGSNAARVIYAVLMAGSILFSLGTGFDGVTRLDTILSVVMLPVDAYILYCLFNADANGWFSTPRT